MLPSQTRLDPDGYYDRLGLEPAATHADIVTAFRGKARVLHPDVPETGNASAFVALKQAYDVLSNQERRTAYDRRAVVAALTATEPATVMRQPAGPPTGPPTGPSGRQLRYFDLPVTLWVALGAFLCLCLFQAVTHLLAPSKVVRDAIRPNAATVAPLSPSAHQAVLYGPTPVRLAGMPNFYVMPAANPATLWRLDAERGALVPVGQLPPFSVVQVVRLIRQSGMLEVLLNDHGDGFIRADHLTPGNASAARRAYCGYNAGPTPNDGELLERRGSGTSTLELANRAVQPAVVKLRDKSGAVVLSVFLGPGGHVVLNGLPEGTYHTEFAVGELWSRACNSFAAGMRALRMNAALILPGDAHLEVAPDAGEPATADHSGSGVRAELRTLGRTVCAMGYRHACAASGTPSGDDGVGGAGLIAAGLPEGHEIDRLQQHRREPAVAGDIGQDVAGEREQDARAFHQQHRLDRIFGQAAQREHAGIGQFGDEDRRRRCCRLTVGLRRLIMGLGADDDRDLEDALAFLHAPSLHVEVDADLRLGLQLAENLRRTRHFEGQILHILDVDHQRLDRLAGGLRGRSGLGHRGAPC